MEEADVFVKELHLPRAAYMSKVLEHMITSVVAQNRRAQHMVFNRKFRATLLVQNQALLDVKHPSTLIIQLVTNLVEDAEPVSYTHLTLPTTERV